MANKIRIHVKFGETKVLVPCGDGGITISDMVDKAIGKYKKAQKLNENDRIVVGRLYQEDGCLLDLDDDVCDIFDDKDTAILEYQFYPHNAEPDYVPPTIGIQSQTTSSTFDPPQPAPPPSIVTTTVPDPYTRSTPPKPHLTTPPSSNDTTHLKTDLAEPNAPPTLSRALKSSSSLGSHQSDSGYHQTMHSGGGTQGSNRCLTPDNLRSNVQYSVNDQYDYEWSLRTDTPSGDPHNSSKIDEFDDDHTGTRHGHLSQEDPVSSSGQFTDQPSHPVASQVSVHSFEGASQPSLGNSQRFSHSPPVNYEMSMPVSQGSYQDPNSSQPTPSVHHGGIDNMTGSSNSKGNHHPLHSPNIGNSGFNFSPSMDKLNDFHSTTGSKQMSQDNLGNSPFRTNSFHHPQALSQEQPPTSYNSMPGHIPHDNFSMQPPTDPYNMMVMSQPHGGAWPPYNPNVYPNMGGYPQRGGPPFRNQFNRPDFGMREQDRSSVSSNYSEYEFNSGHYPPNMYPPQFMDKDKKRKMSQQEPTDGRGGRGMLPHHVPPYADMYGYQRQFYHGPEEDSSIEVALSQPATYMMYPPHNPYNRYHGYQSPMGPGGPPQSGMGPGLNRMGSSGGGGGGPPPGRVKNVPSGYSLSQGGEPRMRNMGGFGNDKMFGKPRKSTLKNGDRKRSESTSKDNKYSIDEEVIMTDEDEDDDMKPSPFTRSSRKSMYLDDESVWENWQVKMKNMNLDEEYYDEHTNSNPSDDEDKKNQEEEEPSDLGNIHIVELLRGEEPLGIQLVSYTSKGRDLGVFIGELDSDGFAAKSRELQLFDRILACNGEDFTGESNKNVEERLRAMITKEPLLRMAVSRGLNFDLDVSSNSQVEPDDTKTQGSSRPNSTPGSSDLSTVNKPTTTSTNTTSTSESDSTNATTPNLVSTSITNTRQLGVKKKIEIQRSEKGTFGFGLASRDVATNDEIPIYVKSISSGGPAFKDGRLKIGDRILEVNGTSVQGMCQSDVLSLLRSSKDLLELTISRQQLASDPQDEYSDLSQPTSMDQSPLPTTIGKNVFVIDIPLDDCGLQGLGVTVYGRCSKKREDVGIYIKGIQPGGAAAKEGSLRVNDRLLSINNQSLLNMSNQHALDGLKKGLQQASLEPNPVLHVTVARTAGINRKLSLSMSSFSNQMPALHEEDNSDNNRTEIGIDCPPDLGVMSQEIDNDNTPYEDEYNFTSQTSTGSQISYGKSQDVMDLSIGSFPGSQHPFSNSSKLDYEASSNRMVKASASSNIRRGSNQTDNMKGNRLDAHEYSSSERGMKQSLSSRASLPLLSVEKGKYSSSRHTTSMSPTSDKNQWSLGGDSQTSSSQSRGSSHSPTPSRPSSMHNEASDRPTRHNPAHSQNNLPRTMSYGHARVGSGSFGRQVSPPYDTLERSPTKERKQYERDVPQQQKGSSHTLPKQGTSGNFQSGRMSPGMEEVTSLYSYSSDPELNGNFQRGDVRRISIPKKKSSQQPNLSHFKLNNAVPQMEGEGPPSPPLYRTGSDGDLSTHNMHPLPKEMFTNVEVGPSLRMAKSSSLESLQTVMHYTIRSDVRNGDGNIGRGKEARNSFRRAVDRSYSGEPLPSAAVISITKSPQKRKESKKNIFSKLFKKTKNSKKDKNRRSRPDSCVDFDTLGDIAKQYGISEKTILRMQSHSGKIEGDDDLTDEEDEDDYDDDGELDESHDVYPQASQNYRAL